MHIPNRGDYAFFKNSAKDQQFANMKRKLERWENGEEVKKLKETIDKQARTIARNITKHAKEMLKVEKECEKSIKLWQDSAYEAFESEEKADLEVVTLLLRIAELEAKVANLEKDKADLEACLEEFKRRAGLDHTNTNNPSSKDSPAAQGKTESRNRHNRNSRGKTDRKPGAQKNHPHHPRKMLEPTEEPVVHTERPEGTENEEGWELTDRTVTKLEVHPVVQVQVIPHEIAIWRNRITGEIRKSPYPSYLKDEINYSPGAAALYLLWTQFGNVAPRKAKQILSELTGGVLNPSHGWIAGLPHKFAIRSIADLEAIFKDLFETSTMGVDTTVTKNNGIQEAVSIAVSQIAKAVYYVHTEHKGKDAAAALPCAPGLGYQGTVTSDHEAAFIVLGVMHQLCLAHIIRELKAVAEADSRVTWAAEMIKLLEEMLHASHNWGDGPIPEEVEDWENRYDQILKMGLKEYTKYPPTKYYLDGYALRKRMIEDRDMVLLFLHDPTVDPTNNLAERCAKNHKRALHQKTTFRAGTSIDDWCAVMSVLMTRYMRGENLHQIVLEVMSRSLESVQRTDPSPSPEVESAA